MKKIAWLAGVGTLLGATGYMVVSLNRWEWNRALFFGLVVVIAEVALATALVLRRLKMIEAQLTPGDRAEVDSAVLARLRETRPTRDRFAWIGRETGRLNVFITFIVAGGLLISGLAWVVDRIAANTTSRAGEARLASQLGRLSYPRGGLLVDDVTVLAETVPGVDNAQLRTLLRRAGR